MNKISLVIMAAGMASRYGGMKQLEPVGPSGEIIMDYSIHDAVEAGFNKVVFIIREDFAEEFKETIGKRTEQFVEVEYVNQDLTILPEGYSVPADRTKPWGTAHAVLCCKDVISEPFAVINADDYYGKEAFVKMYDYLLSSKPDECCMVGFILKNTLSDNGTVTRGICEANEQGYLTAIAETSNVYREGDIARGDNLHGKNLEINLNSIVSMNMWGFHPSFIETLLNNFKPFLDSICDGDVKKEYLLPILIGELVRNNKISVKVLQSLDNWFGVTYKEDREVVVQSFKKLVEQGVYPKSLF